jgi:hypothetical protein
VLSVCRLKGHWTDNVRLLPKSPHAKRMMRKRSEKSERPFAWAKGNHGFDKAQRRGRENMFIQGLLTATVINVKQLVKATKRANRGAMALRETAVHGRDLVQHTTGRRGGLFGLVSAASEGLRRLSKAFRYTTVTRESAIRVQQRPRIVRLVSALAG